MIPEAVAQAELEGYPRTLKGVVTAERLGRMVAWEQNKTLYEMEGEWNYLKNCTGSGD
jgi:hypothetical protein